MSETTPKTATEIMGSGRNAADSVRFERKRTGRLMALKACLRAAVIVPSVVGLMMSVMITAPCLRMWWRPRRLSYAGVS